MELENDNLEENYHSKPNENGFFGLLALVLILINAITIYNLFVSLNQKSSLVNKLWSSDNEGFLFFSIPTFIFVCLIVIWIITPKATQMKQIFKISGIIGSILYVLFLLLMLYVIGLARGMGGK